MSDTIIPASAPVESNTPVVNTQAPIEQKLQENIPLTKEEKKYIKSLELKIDGKTVNEELPFEIPDDPAVAEYMRKHLQMSKMGHNKASQYKQLESEVVEFLQELKSNPRKALSNPAIGVDVRELAKAVIEEEIAQSKKTPEQIEKEKLEDELKGLREKAKKQDEDLKQREIERLTQLETERYDDLLSKAIEGAKLPQSSFVVKKIADYMLVGLDAGIDVQPEDVVELVKEDLNREMRDMFGSMPDEALEAFLGRDRLKTMRNRNINKGKQELVKKATAAKVTDTSKSEVVKDKAPEKKVSYKDFFNLKA